MSAHKNMALAVLNRLRVSMNDADYNEILFGLNEIESLEDRDSILEALWEQFGDVPMDPNTECLEEGFLHWPPGTHREEIWHWFDHRHSKGIGYLLYHDGIDRTDVISKMVYLRQLCIECESVSCQFNYDGECRFPLVHERAPRITDTDGCIDYDYSYGGE